MIKIILIIILILIVLIINFGINREGFSEVEIPRLYRPFINLQDDRGNRLNVVLVSHPFSRVTGKGSYQDYLDNKDKCIFIGISSYSTYPSLVVNPHDSMNNPEDNVWKYDYLKLFDGWFHPFRRPEEYLKTSYSSLPKFLLSESDFIDIDDFKPKNDIVRDLDFIYICPADKEDCKDEDWISFSKNWKLARPCIEKMCSLGLKGVLVGRYYCKFSKLTEERVIKTKFLDKDSLKGYYNRCKFIFVPNKYDASPRILTEALCMDCRCLVYSEILGGWKYVNGETGEFFTGVDDVESGFKRILTNYQNYSPRNYYISHYGKKHSGKRLRDFLLKHYKDRINQDLTKTRYVDLKLDWV